MPIMEISILPLGTESASVSKHIKDALDILKGKGDIQYQVTAMGTIIETRSVKTLLNIAKEMHKSTLAGAARVVTSIKIDDRKDKKLTIQGKIDKIVVIGCSGTGALAARMVKKLNPSLDVTIIRGQNVDEAPQTSATYGIRSIPTLGIFKDGQMTDSVLGAVPKNVLIEKI